MICYPSSPILSPPPRQVSDPGGDPTHSGATANAPGKLGTRPVHTRVTDSVRQLASAIVARLAHTARAVVRAARRAGHFVQDAMRHPSGATQQKPTLAQDGVSTNAAYSVAIAHSLVDHLQNAAARQPDLTRQCFQRPVPPALLLSAHRAIAQGRFLEIDKMPVRACARLLTQIVTRIACLTRYDIQTCASATLGTNENAAMSTILYTRRAADVARADSFDQAIVSRMRDQASTRTHADDRQHMQINALLHRLGKIFTDTSSPTGKTAEHECVIPHPATAGAARHGPANGSTSMPADKLLPRTTGAFNLVHVRPGSYAAAHMEIDDANALIWGALRENARTQWTHL